MRRRGFSVQPWAVFLPRSDAVEKLRAAPLHSFLLAPSPNRRGRDHDEDPFTAVFNSGEPLRFRRQRGKSYTLKVKLAFFIRAYWLEPCKADECHDLTQTMHEDDTVDNMQRRIIVGVPHCAR